jgi:hypothetical protein
MTIKDMLIKQGHTEEDISDVLGVVKSDKTKHQKVSNVYNYLTTPKTYTTSEISAWFKK